MPFASVSPLTLLRSTFAPFRTSLITSMSLDTFTDATTLLLEFTKLMKPVLLNITGSLKKSTQEMLYGTSVAPTGGDMEANVGAVVSVVLLVLPATTAAKLSP